MRTFVGRFLIPLALSGVLVVAPTLRVLCYSSCVLEEGPMSDTIAASDAAPECHKRDSRHDSTRESGSAPPQGDCTHEGDSFSSGLLTSAKLVGDDALRIPVIATIAGGPLRDPLVRHSSGLPIETERRSVTRTIPHSTADLIRPRARRAFGVGVVVPSHEIVGPSVRNCDGRSPRRLQLE